MMWVGGVLGRLVRRIAMAIALLLGVAAPAMASPLGPARYSAILIDAGDGAVLYSQAAEEIRHPASITKVMTLFLAFDALDQGRLHLSDRIIMTAHAAAQKPSKLGLRPGQTISVEDAIRVIAVKSANDVAVALAERLGGSEPAFARMMTARARALGMRQTMFSNATGLPDPATFTSAQDLALLALAMLRDHPDRYPYFSTRTFSWGAQHMVNHNHLLGAVPGVDGIKTGYTVDAGFTLAASAIRGGHRLVAVVMGEPTRLTRDRHVATLLEAGFTALDRRAQGSDVEVSSLLGGLLDEVPSGLSPAVLSAIAKAEADEAVQGGDRD
ncbi:MAG TPA: D-alanyl-D-alanine carboxypeptidase family protein [Sphingomonas sp.]|nr:D-alanyl-D-alanine carboxypeptidase family protein [Sphingomonas sp.]